MLGRITGKLLLPILLLATVSAQAAGIEGRWRLVEQRYGSGQANQVSAERPLRLELIRQGSGAVGRIWSGPDAGRSVPWPAFVADDGPRQVVGEQTEVRLDGRRVHTRYRVESGTPGSYLQVEEDYRVTDDGRALVGTVRVTLIREDRPRGGYELHRRFESEP